MDKTLKEIIEKVKENGGKIYQVGGSVRDEILGIPNNDEDYCVHTLRHTCATLLYRKGINIRTIQELLGHVQIDTTEIYTHLHDQEVMDAMLDHPLSQFKMANAEAFCA